MLGQRRETIAHRAGERLRDDLVAAAGLRVAAVEPEPRGDRVARLVRALEDLRRVLPHERPVAALLVRRLGILRGDREQHRGSRAQPAIGARPAGDRERVLRRRAVEHLGDRVDERARLGGELGGVRRLGRVVGIERRLVEHGAHEVKEALARVGDRVRHAAGLVRRLPGHLARTSTTSRHTDTHRHPPNEALAGEIEAANVSSTTELRSFRTGGIRTRDPPIRSWK
jgi:hypothetical protein